MSATTNIEWATHTASPWFGCSKVSPGCTHCYAEKLTLQKKWAGWGDHSPRVRSKGFWTEAYRFNRQAAGKTGPDRPRMFTSLMDWLDPKAPIRWFCDFLQVIKDCQNLDWLLLTKRPELFHARFEEAFSDQMNWDLTSWMSEWESGNAPKNVWFGVTCENQEQLAKRWDALRSIPAAIKWCSLEPLLEPVTLQKGKHDGFSWMVIGGESGPNRRDCGVEAIEYAARQCLTAGVPTFVKQDCAFKPGQQGRISPEIWAIKQYPV